MFSDLKAYSCTFEHCDHAPFGSRTAWSNHEQRHHLRSWRCPICHHASDTQNHVARHVATEHPTIDQALSNELIYHGSPETKQVAITQCPFCDDRRLWKNVLGPLSSATLEDISQEHDVLVPVALFQRHVSRHMEQLALFAVPSSTGDSEDEGDTSDLEPHVSFNADDTIDETHESDENDDVATDVAEEIPPAKPSSHVGAHIEGNSQYPDSHMPDQSSQLSNSHDDKKMELIDVVAVHGLPQRQQQPAQHLTMDAFPPTFPSESSSSTALYNLPPSLSTIPASRNQNDRDDPGREYARKVARRQEALDEAILRRQEELDAAANKQVEHEAERGRHRRSFDPPHGLPDSLHPPRVYLESEHTPRSRHTSPPAPPSSDRPMQTRIRFVSSSPSRSQHRRRPRHYGNATVHQYDRPDSPPRFSRQPSDSIRERGREVIERERARAAAEDRRSDNADNTRSNEAQWEPVFDEDDGRISELTDEDISKWFPEHEVRRRRDRDDSRRREERWNDFFSSQHTGTV